MGNDGHTASIFPWDPESDEVCKNGTIDVFATKAPASPKQRITCSMELITSARHIYLLISGKEKWKVLNEYQYNYPIHKVLERRSDVKIFYWDK